MSESHSEISTRVAFCIATGVERGPSSRTIRAPLFAARTLKRCRSIPGHSIAAVRALKSSLRAKVRRKVASDPPPCDQTASRSLLASALHALSIPGHSIAEKGHSRVTLSLRREHLRAACCPRLEEKEAESRPKRRWQARHGLEDHAAQRPRRRRRRHLLRRQAHNPPQEPRAPRLGRQR